jgi:Zn-dependent protease with chaperone function
MGTAGSATWAELLAQAILHTLVASLLVEALVRSWRVREPGQRMALRLVALGHPLFLFPALVVLFPGRGGDPFREHLALFAGRAWAELRLLGVPALDLWVSLLAGLGALLFLLDAWPILKRRRRPPLADDPEAPAHAALLARTIPDVAARLGLAPPPVLHLHRDGPVLFCTGVARPSVVISSGTLALLDEEELRAALAHELAHLARKDPLRSWVLMAGRALMCLNPAFQVLSRAVARDAEWLADERAAEACGDRLALASALLKLHRATTRPPAVPRTLPFATTLAEPLARVQSLDIEARCRRLLDPAPAPLPFGHARLALAGASLAGLLFFVV